MTGHRPDNVKLRIWGGRLHEVLKDGSELERIEFNDTYEVGIFLAKNVWRHTSFADECQTKMTYAFFLDSHWHFLTGGW
jgi:hypothetical protein